MINFLTLDRYGILAAVVLGIGILFFGGSMGPFFLLVMLWFLVLSGIVTWIGRRRKKMIGVYQRYRSWNNVVANGIVPLLITVLYYFNSNGSIMPNSFIIVSYVASVAAITADKFSSEIGVLGAKPIMLMTLKKVRQGTSGGITAFGIGAGLLGSLLIGVTMVNISNYGVLLVVVIIAGLIGNLVDSIVGYWEEQGIGNKFTTNFLCSVAGWAASLLLLLII
ncbi:MAG: DUF92 domain-containing protein [Candidatus Micrarchaeota archaeon]|nr:DUF92 domain-containing protein [Candidatus Micrarchaeota archaeon]